MRNQSAFSLIEILVVITIIGLLIGISTGAYSLWITRGEISQTENLINNLEIYADEYANITGDFPPSSLSDLDVHATDDSNEGIEAFTLAIFRKDYTGPRPDSASELINSDDDQADRNISTFGLPVLLEFQDAWGNPVIYIHNRDYGEAFRYLLEDPEIGQDSREVQALKNPVTGTYYNFDSYQIISVGPDGIFDTEDDVASFTRQE